MEVTGTLTVSGLNGSGIVSTSNIASGAVTQAIESGGILPTITTTKSAAGDYDVADSVTITTGASTLFSTWSGSVTTDAVNRSIRIALIVDGAIVPQTYRQETTDDGQHGQSNMATSALVNVAAGTHTVELGWNVSKYSGDGVITGAMSGHTLDVIELKK